MIDDDEGWAGLAAAARRLEVERLDNRWWKTPEREPIVVSVEEIRRVFMDDEVTVARRRAELDRDLRYWENIDGGGTGTILREVPVA